MTDPKKGGVIRAQKLSPARRTEIANLATAKRWDFPVAEYTGVIEFKEVRFSCSVLANEQRVISQKDFIKAMGMYSTGWKPKKKGVAVIPPFLEFEAIFPFVNNHLKVLQSCQVKYLTKSNQIANGITADAIPVICDIFLDAADQGMIKTKRLQEIARNAYVVMRELARVAIIALVDEATGYQKVRAKNALAQILERYLSKELRCWIKTFPDEYYEEICRLKNIRYSADALKKGKRPRIFGKITNDIIYSRLAPGVLDELKRLEPADSKGNRKHKFHQWLSQDHGFIELSHHLSAVVMLMRSCEDYQTFKKRLDISCPIINHNLELAI